MIARAGLHAALVGAVVLGACYTGPELTANPYGAAPRPDAGTVGPSDLPCEVRTFVAEQCGACHGEALQG
ncbi:MAG: hypothetical protein HOO96_34615, partial [Polyangiaceae bacterium]|nr:hypothetical protein [Polyangiaceae bacterium]